MSLEELARIRHEEMKPFDIDETADTRSRKRIDFCEAVVQEGSTVAMRLVEDEQWSPASAYGDEDK
ncbi:hypothetical protein FGG08_002753 [Glutinoglossum americanum]|uniref:Uncharacterized protein n=1 Tax=Glutinoglossum americanum TaxID=1670608 RepID=A0A9P8HZM3_9PEZI|nr:hypothetical protein FGG08_002753 [Glutinoglossum americanum]